VSSKWFGSEKVARECIMVPLRLETELSTREKGEEEGGGELLLFGLVVVFV